MRRVVRVLLLAFAFAVPWQYSLDLGAPIGNIARVAGLALFAAAIPAVLLAGRMRTPGPAQWLALCLFLWFCCTCFWTIDEAATLVQLRAYLQVMMPLWLLWEFADTPKDLRNVLRAFVAGSWVLAGLTIAAFASASAADQVRFVAKGQDPNDVARFLVLAFPFGALLVEDDGSLLWKWIGGGYLPVGLIGVLLTASRGGVLAAIVALAGCGFVLARHHRGAVLAGAVSLSVIAVGFRALVPSETMLRFASIPEQLSHGDLNQRLNIWTAGWRAFAQAPFFGSGAGTFVQAARLARIDTAHNTALSLGVDGGIVGLILASALLAFCAASVLAARGSERVTWGTSLAVWLATSMVATVETNRMTWLLFGMVAVAGRLAQREAESKSSCSPGEVGLRRPAAESA